LQKLKSEKIFIGGGLFGEGRRGLVYAQARPIREGLAGLAMFVKAF
jgi:hypothetical protein